MTVLAAIPARHGSTRFPGKPLAPILGRPMIDWVVEAARGARRVDDVAVITDSEAIAAAAREARARTIVSRREAASGSDRIGHLLALDEAASRARIVVNLQGDEPALEPEAIDRAIELLDAGQFDVATLVRAIRDGERADDSNLVKVVMAEDGRAISFSRVANPRGEPRGLAGGDAVPWIHVGLYAYRRAAFERFVAAPPSARERGERLEQLRALDLGLAIGCEVVHTQSVAVDVPEDVPRVEAVLRHRLDATRPPS